VKSPGRQEGVEHGVTKKNMKVAKKDTPVSASKKMRGALGEITNNLNVVNQLSRRTSRGKVKVESEVKDEPTIKTEEDHQDPEMDGLCEYEKIRLKNIRERQAMFAELELNGAKSDYTAITTPKLKASAPSKRGIAGEGRPREVLPPRPKSARIAGGKVAEIERFVPLVDDTPDDPPLILEDITIKDSLSKSDDMKEALAASFLTKLSENIVTEEVETTPGSSMSKNLTLTEESVAKVTPGRIFSMAVNPSSTALVVAVGDKYGGVGLWDVENASAPDNGVHLFSPHTKPVNCLSWDLANCANLLTTSYDGSVRLLDAEKQEFSLVYAEEEFISWGGWTSFHTQLDAHSLLVSKGSTGSVALVDRRVGWRHPTATYQLYQKTHAKSTLVHPTRPQLLLAGNNKAECCVFDLRTATAGKLLPRYSSLNGHAKSISSCDWSPRGDKVVTIAKDDRVRLFDTSSFKPEMGPASSVRHNNETGRWLSQLRVCWDPRPGSGRFYTGSLERPRCVEEWGVASVCSIISVHPCREVVVGGNSSGRVHCFM